MQNEEQESPSQEHAWTRRDLLFSQVEAAPSLDGDKIMRLHSQTAKIEGGFVLLPNDAPWLDA